MTEEHPDLMSAPVEVQRTDHTGTIWFAAAIVAVAVFAGSIILSGWRPADLAPGGTVAWWIGFALAALGVAGIGYAGCPIYWGNVEVAHWQKSVAIRAGLVLFLVGSVTLVVAMLAG
jgi:uncharacterized membrane protein YbhN (UPF0104 family)